MDSDERVSVVLQDVESSTPTRAVVHHVGLGEYVAELVPKMSGPHTLSVLLGEEHIQSSPSELTVKTGGLYSVVQFVLAALLHIMSAALQFSGWQMFVI